MTIEKPTVLLTNHYSGIPLQILTEESPSAFEVRMLDKATKEDLIQKAPEADYLLASGRLRIDADVISAARRLKMVQRTGVGTDTIDLALLEQRGIPAYVNFGVNSQSVAEHAVLLMLAVLRRLQVLHASVKHGEWRKQELGVQGCEIGGKTIGLVGLGNIGRNVAAMLRGFGTRILYFDVFRQSSEREAELGVAYRELPILLKECDIISLHCSLTEETRGMLGPKEFAVMKPGAVLVNTSRGPLIQEDALVEALESGRLRGAGLDAFATEPITPQSRLLQLENVILTPHVGGVTAEAFGRMMRGAFENIAAFENGDLEKLESKRLTA